MNDFDPWTRPRSYSVPFNPTQPANYAATNKGRRRSTGRGILLLVLSIIAALVVIGGSVAFAQEEQEADIAKLKGQTIGITAIICLRRPDADALLGHIQHGGVAEGDAPPAHPTTPAFWTTTPGRWPGFGRCERSGRKGLENRRRRFD